MREQVILVDSNDIEIGVEEKMVAHRMGKLHRAVSVFVFDSNRRLLMQRRAFGKYHSGGLWSNTCCSHPRPGEHHLYAASRRLREEMGIDCEVRPAVTFSYRAVLENGLTEHEFDHVYVAQYSGKVIPNPCEVVEWKWLTFESLRHDMNNNPHCYTAWSLICIDEVLEHVGRSKLF